MTGYDEYISLPIRIAIRDGDVTILGDVVGVGPGIDAERGWPERKDIVERLRDRSKHWCNDHSVSVCDECSERSVAADEIERLRSLITAWADADLGRLDMTRPTEDLNAAVNALRKAVGR